MTDYLSGERIQGSSEAADKTILVFNSTGSFTPTESFDVEYLVIGGGAGGGRNNGGGGGAGAYRTATGLGVTAQAYTVTVGAGGTGNTSSAPAQWRDGDSTTGGDSVFSTITSEGGGAGGGEMYPSGGSRDGYTNGNASAGGAGNNEQGGSSGAYGYDGGDSPNNHGGGGGGSSAVGADSYGGNSGGYGGNGGAGTSSSITGTAVVRAGGGGGASQAGTAGTGGSGGGGNGGGSNTVGSNATANTGSGGGGGQNANGGVGGSGVVILSFAGGKGYSATGSPTVVSTTIDEKVALTNVPVGTRYEETDTRKIFRSYETDADGDWEDGTFGSPWTTDSGDDCTIANGGITVLPNSNDYDGMTFDLQSASGINTTVNSSAWVWQFTIDQVAFSNNGACDYRSGFVTLSSVAGRSGDHVIFHIENTNCGFQASGYRFCIKNSGNHDGGQESESSSRHFKPASNAMITASTTQGSSSDGKIGIRITRTASDAFKFQVYNDPTFAGTPTTDVDTTSTSICGDCTALRYINVGGYKQGAASGSSEFIIDDMKFWNGVTTPTQTIAWKEKGTA